MLKVEVKSRQASFLVRILLLFSIGVFFLSVQTIANYSYLFLLSFSILLISGYFYLKTPVLNIIVIALENEILSFRTRSIMDENYQEPIHLNINDILYFEFQQSANNHSTGVLNIKCYTKEAGVINLSVNSKYAAKCYDIIDKVLEMNPSIKLIKAKMNDVSYIFRAYKDRFVEEAHDDYDFGGWKKDLSFKNKIDSKDWEQLKIAPITVFLMIARADGVVTKNEISRFVSKIKQPTSFKSFMLAEILEDVVQEIDALLNEVVDKNPDSLLMEAVKILHHNVDQEEAENFKSGLLNIAEGLAVLKTPSETKGIVIKNTLNKLTLRLQ